MTHAVFENLGARLPAARDLPPRWRCNPRRAHRRHRSRASAKASRFPDAAQPAATRARPAALPSLDCLLELAAQLRACPGGRASATACWTATSINSCSVSAAIVTVQLVSLGTSRQSMNLRAMTNLLCLPDVFIKYMQRTARVQAARRGCSRPRAGTAASDVLTCAGAVAAAGRRPVAGAGAAGACTADRHARPRSSRSPAAAAPAAAPRC